MTYSDAASLQRRLERLGEMIRLEAEVTKEVANPEFEKLHHRDSSGRFAPKPGGSASTAPLNSGRINGKLKAAVEIATSPQAIAVGQSLAESLTGETAQTSALKAGKELFHKFFRATIGTFVSDLDKLAHLENETVAVTQLSNIVARGTPGALGILALGVAPEMMAGMSFLEATEVATVEFAGAVAADHVAESALEELEIEEPWVKLAVSVAVGAFSGHLAKEGLERIKHKWGANAAQQAQLHYAHAEKQLEKQKKLLEVATIPKRAAGQSGSEVVKKTAIALAEKNWATEFPAKVKASLDSLAEQFKSRKKRIGGDASDIPEKVQSAPGTGVAVSPAQMGIVRDYSAKLERSIDIASDTIKDLGIDPQAAGVAGERLIKRMVGLVSAGEHSFELAKRDVDRFVERLGELQKLDFKRNVAKRVSEATDATHNMDWRLRSVRSEILYGEALDRYMSAKSSIDQMDLMNQLISKNPNKQPANLTRMRDMLSDKEVRALYERSGWKDDLWLRDEFDDRINQEMVEDALKKLALASENPINVMYGTHSSGDLWYLPSSHPKYNLHFKNFAPEGSKGYMEVGAMMPKPDGIFHELGHNREEILDLAPTSNAFLKTRTGDAGAEAIQDLPGVKGYRDEFFEHYTGRVYDESGTGYTEVIATGLESLGNAFDPSQLSSGSVRQTRLHQHLERDREHVLYAMSTLKKDHPLWPKDQ